MSPAERLGDYVPLLLFTAMALIASGLVVAAGAAHLLLPAGWSLTRPLLVTALLLLTAGGAMAMLHLGRPWRAGMAVAAIGRSWLSREVGAVGVLAVSTTLALVIDLAGNPPPPVWGTIALAAATMGGLLTAMTVGKVYDLPAQAGWRGPAQWLTPPIATLLLASVLLAAAPGGALLAGLAAALLGADALLLTLRIAAARRRSRRGPAPTFARHARVLTALYVLRAALVPAAATSMLLGWHAAAPVLVAVMLIIDRCCLYAGSARVTPSTEMAILKKERMRQATARPRT